MDPLPFHDPTDEDLQALDDALADEGVPIMERLGNAALRWANQHGIHNAFAAVSMLAWSE